MHIHESQDCKINAERIEINANIQQNCTEEGADYAYGIIQLLTPLNFGLLLRIHVFICCNSAVLYATSGPSGKHMQLVHIVHWSILRKPKRMIAPWQYFC